MRNADSPHLSGLSLPRMYDDILLLVHPWVAPTFLSVVDPDWGGQAIANHVNRDVERVVGNPVQWNIRYEFVGTDVVLGARVDRILVTCIPDSALLIGKFMGAPTTEVKCTIAAIAGIIAAEDVGHQEFDAFERVTAAIGVYGNRLEISIHQAGAVRFSGFLDEIDADSATQRIDALMKSIGMQRPQSSRVLLYGHDATGWEVSDSETFSRSKVEWLDPTDIFGPTSRKVTTDSTFAPVAAGAFNRLLSHV